MKIKEVILIVLGLGISRKETKKIHNFLNNQEKYIFDYESDLEKISWYDSENIVINRIEHLENKLYKNTNSENSFAITGDVGFYYLPYIELLLNNFPYLKVISTKKSKKKTFADVMSDIETKNSFLSRLFMFKKKYKNHWINHNGSNWEKDFQLDKCYPKFNVDNLDSSINNYIEMYIFELKKIQKKFPKNIRVFFSDELDSEYGKKKVLSYLGNK